MTHPHPDPVTIHDSAVLSELGRDECRRLLATRTVGRLVWHGRDGLTAVPVNHVVDRDADGDVLRIRTTAYSAITQECDDGLVAYEVDDLDEQTHSGWSVLVRGRAELSFDGRPDEAEPDPWPSGLRPVHLALHVHDLTGRRLGG